MFYGGVLGSEASKPYLGGSVSCLDYCHIDEISLIELCTMARQLVGTYVAIDFYTMVGGGFTRLKYDSDAMGMVY